MTGFIKPGEIYSVQKTIVELLKENDMQFGELDEETREFMMLNPVTKEKEGGKFRKADGVWVSESAYEDAESMMRPVDEMVGL